MPRRLPVLMRKNRRVATRLGQLLSQLGQRVQQQLPRVGHQHHIRRVVPLRLVPQEPRRAPIRPRIPLHLQLHTRMRRQRFRPRHLLPQQHPHRKRLPTQMLSEPPRLLHPLPEEARPRGQRQIHHRSTRALHQPRCPRRSPEKNHRAKVSAQPRDRFPPRWHRVGKSVAVRRSRTHTRRVACRVGSGHGSPVCTLRRPLPRLRNGPSSYEHQACERSPRGRRNPP